jgi:hypothetical protein
MPGGVDACESAHAEASVLALKIGVQSQRLPGSPQLSVTRANGKTGRSLRLQLLLVCVEGEFPPSNTDLCDCKNRPIRQCRRVPIQQVFESLIYVRWSHTTKSEDHDARQDTSSPGHEITKIQVVSEEDPLFLTGSLKNFPVLSFLFLPFNEMNGIVAPIT